MSSANVVPSVTWRHLFATAALLFFHVAGQCADDLLTSQMVDEARLWQSKGRSDLAGNTWRRILITHPDHVEALSNLGLIEARAGNLPEARALFQRAKRQGKQNSALTRLEAMLRQSPAEAEAGASTTVATASMVRAPSVTEPVKPKAPTVESKPKALPPETSSAPPRQVSTAIIPGVAKEGKDAKPPVLAAKQPAATVALEPVPPPSAEVRVTPLPLAAAVTSQPAAIKGDGSDDIALKPAETLRGAAVATQAPHVSVSGAAGIRRPKPCRLPLANNPPTGNN